MTFHVEPLPLDYTYGPGAGITFTRQQWGLFEDGALLSSVDSRLGGWKILQDAGLVDSQRRTIQ